MCAPQELISVPKVRDATIAAESSKAVQATARLSTVLLVVIPQATTRSCGHVPRDVAVVAPKTITVVGAVSVPITAWEEVSMQVHCRGRESRNKVPVTAGDEVSIQSRRRGSTCAMCAVGADGPAQANPGHHE